MTSGELQFAAFLSYSRKDVRLARWLVRSLEEFRLPRQTVDDLKARSASFVAARPIFRDEHDMPVGGVISERLSEMLDASATMIVLCTGSSAKSDWVNKEIALFASRHPDRRIIPAVVEGEPDSDDSYPPAMLKLGKPLAADLRDPSERRQSVIKIAAAVLGLDVDQLVGRMQKHRAEQWRLIAVGGGAAAAVVAGLGVTAAVMAGRADREVDSARQSVEVLLTEAREEVKAVGQLNARGAILAAAEIYFEGRRPGEMKEADLLLKAKLLMQKGQDASERGNVEEGLRLFEAAFAATEELVSRRPSDPERLFAHGQSAFWVGDLYRQSFDLERSSYYLETYKTATQSALDLQPDYPDATLELAYANVNLGQLAVELSRDPRAASGLFADALKIVEAEASDKEALQNLNLILGYQAQAMAQFDLASNVLQVMDKWDIVVGELDKARKSDRSLNYDVARDLNVMGELERRAGATERGEAHVARAREIARQELTTDPSNDTWLSLASRLELKVAAQGCPKAGEENAFEFSDAVEVRRALSCLERSDVRKATICRDFVDWLATQKPNFIAEITWAGILSRCSRDGAVSADSLLLEAHDRAAETIFFAKSPHTYSIWAQTELAKFNSAGRNTVRVQKLRDDLKRRGWNASQKIQE